MTHQSLLTALPKQFTINVTNLALITLTGPEREKYLQGQVTCDVIRCELNNWVFGAHCDAKGKTFSVFRLIKTQDSLHLLLAKSCLDKSLSELKKYGVFSKVEITAQSFNSTRVINGEELVKQDQLASRLLPQTMDSKVAFDGVNFLIVLDKNQNRYLMLEQQNTSKATESLSNEYWQLLEMQSGVAQLDEASISEYVPQMLSLEKIDGISFTKGCYIGQETVARMHYLGKNKRTMVVLSADIDEAASLEDDFSVEMQLENNWRRAGTTISHCKINNTLFLQVVLPSDIDENCHFRLKNKPECTLTLSA